MNRSRLPLLLLVPLAFLLMGARQVPLVDPEPIAVPAGLTAKDVSKAVRLGLAQRGWVVSSEEPGRIGATLSLRSHVARIAVSYDDEAIRVSYVDSTNLMYEEKKGGRVIHRNYLNWINNVVRDISSQLQIAAAQAED